MLGVNVSYHGNRRRQAINRAVRFVGFNDHPFAGAQARIRSVGINNSTVDHGRVQLGCFQNTCDQRCGGCLAVRAANRNRPFQSHQLGEHFSAPDHRQHALACGENFRVFGFDRRRNDDDPCLAQVLGAVAHFDFDTEAAQTVYIGVLRDVAALDFIAKVMYHFSNAAHADAADADEVNNADVEWHGLHQATPRVILWSNVWRSIELFLLSVVTEAETDEAEMFRPACAPFLPWATVATTAAIRLAASGMLKDCAAAAASVSRCGCSLN